MKFASSVYKAVSLYALVCLIALPGMLMPLTVRYGQWENCPDFTASPKTGFYGRRLKIRTNGECKSVRLGVSGNNNNDRPRLFAIIGKASKSTILEVYADGASTTLASCPQGMSGTTALVNFPALIYYKIGRAHV